MSSEDKHIDDFFRDNINSLEINNVSRSANWEDMQRSLDQPGPGPKKSISKKITRRWITYLGLAALVTTVTYYTVNNKSTNKQTVNKKATNSKPTVDKAKVSTAATIYYPKKNNKPAAVLSSKKSSGTNTVITTIRSVSDTIFQQPVSLPATKTITALSTPGFYTSMKEPEQNFEVSVGRDTLLFGREGTVLHIPKGVFLSKYGKVEGVVKINLVECYSYPQMLAYDLCTTADGKPLVTGGMIRIHAFQENETLSLYYGRPLSVSMPMEKYDPEMQLFLPKKVMAGETRQSVAKSATTTLNNRSSVLIGSMDKVTSVSFVSMETSGNNWQPVGQNQSFINYRRYASQQKIKLFSIQQKVTGINAPDHAEFVINAGPNISDEKVKQLLLKRYSAAGLKKISIKREDISATFKAKKTNVSINSQGFVGIDSLMVNFETAIKEKLVSRVDSINFEIQKRIDSISFFEKVKADSLEYVNRLEFNKAYSFDISDLGWINCDKFMRTSQPMVEFSIPVDPNTGQQHARFHMVFTNSKSILNGKYANGLVNFGLLPVGEPVNIICIAEKNGEAVGCIQKIITGPAAMATLQFEPINPTEFKNKIMRL